MKPFDGKSIIIFVPDHFGFPEVFGKNLEYLGFTVNQLRLSPITEPLLFSEKIVHGYKKLFLNDKTYKSKIISEKSCQPVITQLSAVKHKADYALVVRPDLLSEAAIRAVTSSAEFTVAYQWDGLGRYPRAAKLINLFDEFYVFDKSDCSKFAGTKPASNFYFDYPTAEVEGTEADVYFVGTFMKDRINELIELSKIFKDLHLKADLTIVSNKKNLAPRYSSLPIKFAESGINFETAAKRAKQAATLLDFQNHHHKGLSMRVFEAVGCEKKLITNNALVKEYDFYDENNILVLDTISKAQIQEFLSLPYKKIAPDVREKHSFTTWINRVLSL